MLRYLWHHKRDEQGFTLIELLIVVAIIAILAAILIPNFLRARAQSQVSASKGNLKNLATALESYFVDNSSYPDDPIATMTTSLVGDPVDNDPASYLRAVPRDPCTRLVYTYLVVGADPPQDYKLSSPDWSASNCKKIVVGDMIHYTPGGGLSP